MNDHHTRRPWTSRIQTFLAWLSHCYLDMDHHLFTSSEPTQRGGRIFAVSLPEDPPSVIVHEVCDEALSQECEWAKREGLSAHEISLVSAEIAIETEDQARDVIKAIASAFGERVIKEAVQ